MNAPQLLALAASDLAVSPTAWQRSVFPPAWRDRILQQHEGIDTAVACPATAKPLRLVDGRILNPGAEIITFTARDLEPYRGFHVFMRALPLLLGRRPAAHVVIAGGSGVSYGRPSPHPGGYLGALLEELGDRLDRSRVHFVGKLAYPDYLNLLRLSSLHVYLTYPFVLSWSMLEAMACGALVVGSNTPPVTEVIRDGVNGLIAPFFDREGLVDVICHGLALGEATLPIRHAARATIMSDFDCDTVCLPAWRRLLTQEFGAPALP